MTVAATVAGRGGQRPRSSSSPRTLAASLSLLLALAMLAATAPTPAAAAPATVNVDAIVIGGGVSGLKAALDLVKKHRFASVVVVEGRDRLGGRVWTVNSPTYGPIEQGAQWIHGSSNPIVTLARQQGWKRLSTSLSDGEVYEALTPTTAAEVTDADDRSWDALFSRLEDFVEGKQDDSPDSASLQSAINQFKSQNGVAGRAAAGLDLKVDSEWVQEYAASPDKLSLNWFDNDKPLSGGDSVLKNGFRQVVDHLQSQFVAAGGKVALNATVTLVETASSPAQRVKVTAADGRSWAAPFAVVTLPVGVLQSGDVTFSPQLPADLRGAIGRLGMGTLNKVVMAFPDSAEWSDVNWIERLPLAADGGRWREFFSLRKATGKPVVVAFNAGDAALYPSSTTDQALVGQAVAALRAMFPDGGIPSAPSAYWVTRWHDDPFSYGSYSVVPPGANGRERAALAKPVGKLLYFAGEAAHKDYPSTVQGAWLSGLDAANKAASDNKSRASG